MERLLFVDDDIELLQINQEYFHTHGYQADTASSPEQALALLAKHTYQCIILDICMEKLDGLSFCREFRKQKNTPIIFLSNLTEEEYLIEGFHCGADDYVTKPYSLPVLELRIQARIRNFVPALTPGLILVEEHRQAYLNGHSLELTTNEYAILEFLKAHQGTPYLQEEIYQALWGEDFYNTHSIQVMIMRIRKKIQALSPEHEYIKTQWGKGYFYVE